MIRRSILALVLAASPALAADEEVTLDAFAVLEATGSLVEIGPERQGFAGEIRGPYFVDTGKGPIPAGEIACVGILDADLKTGAQSANARCRLRAEDGAVAYGGFECEGFRLVGCQGPFVIDGGTGRLAGAKGEGRIVLRRYETILVATPDGRIAEQGLGIASWKGFRITLATAD